MTDINMALLSDFIDESREHLDEMESLLLQLGDDLSNLDLLNDIFRTMHNVKGASQLTGLDKISRLSHRLEDLLDLLRQGSKPTTQEIVHLLITGRDRIVELVSELEDSQEERSSVDDLIEKFTAQIEADDSAAAEFDPEETQVMEAISPVKTTNTVTPDSAKSSSSSDEEHDQELFGIFIDHLKEKFSLLSASASQFKQVPPDVEHVQECKDAVNHLKSSANYMGYDELTSFFANWASSLEEARVDLANGNEAFVDFMDVYLGDLVERYPQLADLATSVYADRQDTTLVENTAAEEEVSQPVETITQPDAPAAIINASLLPDFIDESREHLDEMESLLLQLNDDLGNLTLLDDIFRTMHNVKGASQLTGLDKISRLSHRLEDLLDLLRQGNMQATGDIINLLISGRDRIVTLVSELDTHSEEQTEVSDLIEVLSVLITTGAMATSSVPASVTNEAQQTATSSASTSLEYKEENDKELFDIFVEHLKEQYSFLSSAVSHFKLAPVDDDHLVECKEAVDRLRSSANYMGYDELLIVFSNWSLALEEARGDLAGGNVDLAFMNAYLGELTHHFPVLNDMSIPSFDDTRTPDKITTEYIPAAKSDQKAEEPVKKESAPVVEEKTEVQKSQDNQLMSRLSSALDESLQKVSDSEYETLNDVFDELVTTVDSDSKTLSAAKKNAIAAAKKITPTQQKAEQQKAKDQENKAKKIKKTMRVDADKIDALMNQVGELVVDRSYFYQLFNEMRDMQQYLKEMLGTEQQKELKQFRAFTYRLSEAISSLSRTSNELQEGVMKMRMLPISHLFNRYPRLVHDLTMNMGKKVELILRGEETELDKMIVEEISDPLIHIIRNAIDHGIESAEERLRANKPEEGKLILEAYQESSHIVIEVRDDGRGLDPQKIKDKAVSKGLYTEDDIARLSRREVTNLILQPGFSTAEKITGTSGRGVGMDVVKKNIEKLNGTLDIDTIEGKGTLMRLKIPLTVAIIHALMVRVGADMFTIPLANVDETVRISKDDASFVEGVEVIHLRGVALPIFRLAALFGVKSDQDLDKSFVVIVNTDGQRIGFVVDEMLGQEEVVIKPLEDYVQDRSGFSGATIVGDGRISLILDVYELVKMTASRQIKRHKEQAILLKTTKSKLPDKSGDLGNRLH